MTIVQYSIAIVFGISLAIGQLLFKYAAMQVDSSGKKLDMLHVLMTPAMMLAVVLYGLTVLLYIYLLQQVPLSRAYLFSLAASTMVPILSILIFKEAYSFQYVLGAILVFIGVIISTTS